MASSAASNGAVNFSLAYRAWQGAAGLLTIPLIAHFLASNTQGYYYTFSSLVALQSFFELGLSIVISVFASHEWHRLHRDSAGNVAGDAVSMSRLVSLGRFVFSYFGLASFAYLLVAGSVGFFILSRQPDAGVQWVLPWILQILFAALTLWLLPFLSLLEGCNQVARVAKFRLAQSLVSNAALWTALFGGLQLWALPIFNGVALIMLIGFLSIKEWRFFRIFALEPVEATLSWKQDLLPMQWRLAIQGLFSYLSFPLFTIIVYLSSGAIEAGRMGMTLQIMSGIQSLALVFLVARAPEFALLAASGNRADLVARCRQAALRTMGVMVVMCTGVITVLVAAQAIALPQTSRVLGVGAFVLFSAGIILTTPIQAIAIYLRAHRKELLTAVGVVGGVSYGALAWLGGTLYGPFGIAIAYLVVTGVLILPLTLRVLKQHQTRSE